MHTQRTSAAAALVFTLTAAWLLLYAWRAVVGHLSLSTNAFDLSVFDHALWSLEHGGRGFVTFLGQSILSHHFMPILVVIAPLHAAAPTPITLLLLQIAAAGAAAGLFFRLQTGQALRVDPWLAAALTMVFLLSRRTHGAVVGSFYPEVLQAPLTFAMVLLWPSRRWWVWVCIILLLMTKEDAAIYVGGFAAFALWRGIGSTRTAWTAMALAVAWLAFALLVAIPLSRRADGLGTSNPLLADRYGASEGSSVTGSLVDRVFSGHTGRTLLNLAGSAGYLSLAGLPWMVPALPGLLANVAASPDSMQSALTGHYAWPILPWLFLSAAAGAAWLHGRSRPLAFAVVAVVLAVTVADNPALQRLGLAHIDPEAQQVRAQLARFGGDTVLAQANLIPHLPQSTRVFAAGEGPVALDPDLVLLTTVGNVWPMTRPAVEALVQQYRHDPRYVEESSGPLFAFRRR